MKIKRARIFAWCLAFSLMLTQILFTDAAFSTERVDGSDVYKMAINIAKMGWKTSDTAIVTRGDEIADALAATPLAYAKGKAPILFTKTNQLPSEVLDELIELNVKTV
ncbi:MAG TPA: cell surface protein, partial [Clostridiaceae bacterium]|nr:cell surface protein [Clostridiaceae bacterium]